MAINPQVYYSLVEKYKLETFLTEHGLLELDILVIGYGKTKKGSLWLKGIIHNREGEKIPIVTWLARRPQNLRFYAFLRIIAAGIEENNRDTHYDRIFDDWGVESPKLIRIFEKSNYRIVGQLKITDTKDYHLRDVEFKDDGILCEQDVFIPEKLLPFPCSRHLNALKQKFQGFIVVEADWELRRAKVGEEWQDITVPSPDAEVKSINFSDLEAFNKVLIDWRREHGLSKFLNKLGDMMNSGRRFLSFSAITADDLSEFGLLPGDVTPEEIEARLKKEALTDSYKELCFNELEKLRIESGGEVFFSQSRNKSGNVTKTRFLFCFANGFKLYETIEKRSTASLVFDQTLDAQVLAKEIPKVRKRQAIYEEPDLTGFIKKIIHPHFFKDDDPKKQAEYLNRWISEVREHCQLK